jgi:hypothetical protein
VAVAAVDGPLLQKASTIITQNVSGETPLKVTLAPLLPQGYMAVVNTPGKLGELTPSIITPEFAQILSGYQKNTPITTGITDCASNWFSHGASCWDSHHLRVASTHTF